MLEANPLQPEENNPLLPIGLAAAEGFRSLALVADGRTDVVGGAPCWYCLSTAPVFNGAAIFYESQLNPDTIHGIHDYFTTKGRVYSLLTLEGLTPGAARALHSMGYREYDRMPAMLLEGHPRLWQEHTATATRDLWLSQVKTSEELDEFRRLLKTVFNLAPQDADLVLGKKALEFSNVKHYVGWLGSRPVSTISVVLSGPIPGIWNVAVLSQFRRQGIAAGMMRTILSELGTTGSTGTMLLASDEGLQLYERLGYREVSMVRVYVKRQ